MRPLEILFLVLTLAALLSFLIPCVGRMRVARVLVLYAGLASAAQAVLEGARWQLVPAYAVTACFVVWCLLSGVWTTGDALTLRYRARLSWFAGVGMGALTLATLLCVAFPVFRFPLPSGPYAIGTLTYHFVDETRGETFTVDPNDRRELMVQVWYPANAIRSQQRYRYMRDGAVLAPVARLLNLPGFVFTHLKFVLTNAVLASSVEDGLPAYPVLIFSHGRGGFRQHNTFQVEELASHGYIVAAIDHPYAAAGVDFPDGRRASFDRRMLDRQFIDGIIPVLAQDVSFTLDQLAVLNSADPQGVLTGRMDLQRIGVFGVSIGGAVTADSCLRDARLKACLPMDNFMPENVVRQGLRQPTMWISRDAGAMRSEGWAEADIDDAQSTMRATYTRLSGPGYLVLISGMFHQNFSDLPFYLAKPLDVWLGLDGPIEPGRGHAIINAYARAFFDRHLKGTSATQLLDGPSGQYPEVIFEHRN
jgi:predicted dienelactone hydrolase